MLAVLGRHDSTGSWPAGSCWRWASAAMRSRIGSAAGRLHRIHRGVYAVGHGKLTLKGRWMAAVLACGPEAFLSHRAALALWDLRDGERVG